MFDSNSAPAISPGSLQSVVKLIECCFIYVTGLGPVGPVCTCPHVVTNSLKFLPEIEFDYI